MKKPKKQKPSVTESPEDRMLRLRSQHKERLEAAQDLIGKDDAKCEAEWRWYVSEVDPEDPQILYNLGVCIQQRANCPEQRHEAADFYSRAISSPVCALDTKSSAMNALGLLMMKVGRNDKALICFNLALQIDAGCKEAVINRGTLFLDELEFEKADAEFEQILRLAPEDPTARMNSGIIKLLMGDLKAGFRDYEYRFQVQDNKAKRIQSSKPLWKGEPLLGKTILLSQEQGFGDLFQFVRYSLILAMQGATVWLVCDKLCVELLKGVPGLSRVSDTFDDAEPFDYHCPIMSVPHFVGTTLENVPNGVPYIMPRDWAPAGEKRWPRVRIPIREEVYEDNCDRLLSAILGDKRSKCIALVWAGSPRHGKDYARSMEPEVFQPLIDAHPECQFYSLQVGPKADQVSRLKNVIDLAPIAAQSGDWTGTAQILQQIDLLITVDTACAHLAGALARPVWMLCPLSPDWRWMLGRESSPWYPTMRLFRQAKKDGWGEVIERVNQELFKL